jgi:hypothetical protein
MSAQVHRRPERLGSVSATLPSLRLLLLFAGVLVLAESAVFGIVMFALAALSFAASLGLATLIYRRRSNVAVSDGAEVRPSEVAMAPRKWGRRPMDVLP